MSHKIERDKLVATSPSVRDVISCFKKLSDHDGSLLVVKDEWHIKTLKDALERVQKDLFAFIQLASRYQTDWYRLRPVK